MRLPSISTSAAHVPVSYTHLDVYKRQACVLKTSKCAGKSIVTCEGLSPRERDVYAWAFTSCGAVQCGFCTPGMVISAKGLIDAVPDPTPDQDVYKRQTICCGFGEATTRRQPRPAS